MPKGYEEFFSVLDTHKEQIHHILTLILSCNETPNTNEKNQTLTLPKSTDLPPLEAIFLSCQRLFDLIKEKTSNDSNPLSDSNKTTPHSKLTSPDSSPTIRTRLLSISSATSSFNNVNTSNQRSSSLTSEPSLTLSASTLELLRLRRNTSHKIIFNRETSINDDNHTEPNTVLHELSSPMLPESHYFEMITMEIKLIEKIFNQQSSMLEKNIMEIYHSNHDNEILHATMTVLIAIQACILNMKAFEEDQCEQKETEFLFGFRETDKINELKVFATRTSTNFAYLLQQYNIHKDNIDLLLKNQTAFIKIQQETDIKEKHTKQLLAQSNDKLTFILQNEIHTLNLVGMGIPLIWLINMDLGLIALMIQNKHELAALVFQNKKIKSKLIENLFSQNTSKVEYILNNERTISALLKAGFDCNWLLNLEEDFLQKIVSQQSNILGVIYSNNSVITAKELMSLPSHRLLDVLDAPKLIDQLAKNVGISGSYLAKQSAEKLLFLTDHIEALLYLKTTLKIPIDWVLQLPEHTQEVVICSTPSLNALLNNASKKIQMSDLLHIPHNLLTYIIINALLFIKLLNKTSLQASDCIQHPDVLLMILKDRPEYIEELPAHRLIGFFQPGSNDAFNQIYLLDRKLLDTVSPYLHNLPKLLRQKIELRSFLKNKEAFIYILSQPDALELLTIHRFPIEKLFNESIDASKTMLALQNAAAVGYLFQKLHINILSIDDSKEIDRLIKNANVLITNCYHVSKLTNLIGNKLPLYLIKHKYFSQIEVKIAQLLKFQPQITQLIQNQFPIQKLFTSQIGNPDRFFQTFIFHAPTEAINLYKYFEEIFFDFKDDHLGILLSYESFVTQLFETLKDDALELLKEPRLSTTWEVIFIEIEKHENKNIIPENLPKLLDSCGIPIKTLLNNPIGFFRLLQNPEIANQLCQGEFPVESLFNNKNGIRFCLSVINHPEEACERIRQVGEEKLFDEYRNARHANQHSQTTMFHDSHANTPQTEENQTYETESSSGQKE